MTEDLPFRNSQSAVPVPSGMHYVQVVLVGGAGGGNEVAQGGAGAEASGWAEVQPNQDLFVNAGQAGNGGGWGGAGTWADRSGGSDGLREFDGGGATSLATSLNGTITDLAGGGGAAGTSAGFVEVGGAGGSAGTDALAGKPSSAGDAGGSGPYAQDSGRPTQHGESGQTTGINCSSGGGGGGGFDGHGGGGGLGGGVPSNMHWGGGGGAAGASSINPDHSLAGGGVQQGKIRQAYLVKSVSDMVNGHAKLTFIVGNPDGVATFTSADTAQFVKGRQDSFTVTTDDPTAKVALDPATPLPAGLSFQDKGDGTAIISGTPATGTGALPYDVKVIADNGTTTTQTLHIQIGI
ncbi:hypothetical protein [Streptomyces sp. NPDC058272]|uniref:hypothetical protein n=1 Tax=unclassified Streptomyces TaxID=2593676 RepID=UPI0036EB27D3